MPIEKRTQIINLPVEENSMRATSRIADCSINTVTKLLIDVGMACSEYQDKAISACIIVLDKENAHTRRGIFMVDASGGYMKDGPKNRLRDMDRMGSRVSISNAKRQ